MCKFIGTREERGRNKLSRYEEPEIGARFVQILPYGMAKNCSSQILFEIYAEYSSYYKFSTIS